MVYPMQLSVFHANLERSALWKGLQVQTGTVLLEGTALVGTLTVFYAPKELSAKAGILPLKIVLQVSTSQMLEKVAAMLVAQLIIATV